MDKDLVIGALHPPKRIQDNRTLGNKSSAKDSAVLQKERRNEGTPFTHRWPIIKRSFDGELQMGVPKQRFFFTVLRYLCSLLCSSASIGFIRDVLGVWRWKAPIAGFDTAPNMVKIL
jgi:hypothetical protein